MQVLTKRADFLLASRAKRVSTPGFVVQARHRTDTEHLGARVGFTCSKKVGNAVARNRAKRRLRAIARDVIPNAGKDGWDYVLIGRAEKTANHPYTSMTQELAQAMEKLHNGQGQVSKPYRPRR